MLRKMLLVPSILLLLAFVGCDEDDPIYDPRPEPPQGVYSVTGDGEVYIGWAGPYERDIVEYVVYRNDDALDAPYEPIATVDAESNPDLDLIYYSFVDDDVANGVTYFYAVASVDRAGQVSTLSAEDIDDTPRPEGEVDLYDVAVDADVSGFNLAARSRVSAFNSLADVFVDRDLSGVFYLNTGYTDGEYIYPRGFIQDMGFHEYFDEVDEAPEYGWSELSYVEIIPGHIYVILTEDNRFAKMAVTDINASGYVSFIWAYQRQEGNPELVAPNDEGLSRDPVPLREKDRQANTSK